MTLINGWFGGRRRAQVVALSAAVLCLMVAAAALGVAALGTGSAGIAGTDGTTTAAIAGQPVPADLVSPIIAAAKSCPALTSARIAGQLMAASSFKSDATGPNGSAGLAGLTDALWEKWAPTASAKRDDAKANVEALAHYMCDLIGQARVAGLSVDLWRAALGAYHSGIESVRSAQGVSTDALSYVNTVAGYAAWYQQLREFGGSGIPTPTPTSAPTSAPSAAVATRIAPAETPTARTVTAPVISFRVTTPNYTDRYLRHFDSFAITSVIDANSAELDRQDASFRAGPGLASSTCYSFESVNYPGKFLRDASYRVRIDANDNSRLFAVDATFCARTALSGNGVSWESFGKPGYYLRHYRAEVWMSRLGGPYETDASNFYEDDTSWRIESCLAGTG